MLIRCLTLLETLIALVLVAAMAALIIPSFMDSLEERSFETAADATNEQLMLARAHAQATGTPVEVTYIADKSQVQARIYSPQSSEKSGSQGEQTRVHNSSATAIAEPWACRPLARSLRMAARPFNPTESSYIDPDAHSTYLDEQEIWNELGKAEDVRLALFMPDGTALLGDRVWLNDEKGRSGVFTIDPFSGLPFFKRLADFSREQQRKQRQAAIDSTRE